jgi:hypothetical protein
VNAHSLHAFNSEGGSADCGGYAETDSNSSEMRRPPLLKSDNHFVCSRTRPSSSGTDHRIPTLMVTIARINCDASLIGHLEFNGRRPQPDIDFDSLQNLVHDFVAHKRWSGLGVRTPPWAQKAKSWAIWGLLGPAEIAPIFWRPARRLQVIENNEVSSR